MSKKEKAVESFLNGYNCSQAVFGAFSDSLGLDRDVALRISTGFGGGCRRGEICGAASGALMALGLGYGQHVQGDQETKDRAYALTRDFLARFEAETGSVRCKEILGYDLSDPEDYPIIVKKGLFRTVCPKAIETSVEILESLMAG